MRKLLFVPADPQVTQALAEAFRAPRQPWQPYLAATPEAAQQGLAEKDLDAVIADMDTEAGRALLNQARACFPEVARIGVVPQEHLKIPQLGFVHQAVPSFTDFPVLEIAVERSCRLRDLLRGERICRTLGELGELPPAPGVYLRLLEKLNRPDASLAEVAAIIEGDVGTSAKLLQVVNSIVFRTSREIITVKMAVSFLGLDVIKNVVLSLEAFQAFGKLPALPDFSWTGLQEHCRLTAAIAGQMPLSGEARDAAMVGALLHDIGKLVLAYKMPDRFARLLGHARAEGRSLCRVEEELWGITHAEVGAYLLGLWGLPIPVTEAIAFHHAPWTVPQRGFDSSAAVYAANLLAHEVEGLAGHDDWNVAFLDGLGLSAHLPHWKALAQRTVLAGVHAPSRPSASASKQRVLAD
jgi:putative nucleotidyltransferase with HDIG domain